MKEKETFTFKFEVPYQKEKEEGIPTFNSRTSPIKTIEMTMDVKGMMETTKRAIVSDNLKPKDKQDLLDEYAKFWVMNKVGIKTYPLERE